MISWLTINVLISLSVIAALSLLRETPARLRLWLCLLAILAWCLPLQPIQLNNAPEIIEIIDFIPVFEVQEQPVTSLASASPVSSVAETSIMDTLWLSLLFAGSLGLALFMVTVLRSHRQVRDWLKESESGDHLLNGQHRGDISIYILPDSTVATTTGILKQRIWIGDAIARSNDCEVILSHELTHARHHDNLWLNLLVLVKYLFWWNPLVHRLERLGREYLELSCDEVCRSRFGLDRYIKALMSTLRQRQPELAHGLTFTSRQSVLLKRLHHLNKEITMKLRHAMILIGLTLACGLAMVQASPSDSRSLTSITVHDNGHVEIEASQSRLTRLVALIADKMSLKALVEQDLEQRRVNTTLMETEADWQLVLRQILPADTGFVIDGDKLLVATQSTLATGNRDWLESAIDATAIYALKAPFAPRPVSAAHSIPRPAEPVLASSLQTVSARVMPESAPVATTPPMPSTAAEPVIAPTPPSAPTSPVIVEPVAAPLPDHAPEPTVVPASLPKPVSPSEPGSNAFSPVPDDHYSGTLLQGLDWAQPVIQADAC